MLTFSHAGVADRIPLSEQALWEASAAPLALPEIPADAAVVALARYTTVTATIHSRQEITTSRPDHTHLLICCCLSHAQYDAYLTIDARLVYDVVMLT